MFPMCFFWCNVSVPPDQQAVSYSNSFCRITCTNTKLRGIPSGYLSYIEQRLLDTEFVVFELLSAIYQSQIPIQLHRLSETDRQALVDVSQKQSKSAKIEEWKSLPLDTDENRHNWWSKRYESITLPMQSGSDNLPRDNTTPQDTWLEASPMSAHYEDMQLPSVVQPPAPSIGQISPVASWQPPLDAMIFVPAPSFDNNTNTATPKPLLMAASDSDVSVTTSTESSVSASSQSLSADRWRKYF
jgi:hypothetical protein